MFLWRPCIDKMHYANSRLCAMLDFSSKDSCTNFLWKKKQTKNKKQKNKKTFPNSNSINGIEPARADIAFSLNFIIYLFIYLFSSGIFLGCY